MAPTISRSTRKGRGSGECERWESFRRSVYRILREDDASSQHTNKSSTHKMQETEAALNRHASRRESVVERKRRDCEKLGICFLFSSLLANVTGGLIRKGSWRTQGAFWSLSEEAGDEAGSVDWSVGVGIAGRRFCLSFSLTHTFSILFNL